ncbi:MAG: PHP domain-containing protein [Candidatus Endonucleobacter bathymodioli]|uniref:PHP domain-containing protein n=1 Tax=Candidatus Endonucleibacter bathymodioli TaxID=539814 RepID=A0AA90NL69_9GAMM|nr:PHP domain-containing protein [Candidatus Endonucleobacter bathymodioli]
MSIIDLHSHTTASDGSLSPTQLYERAHRKNVTTLAITDHDTLAACKYLSSVSLPPGPRIIPGIELSTTWSGVEIHVIGLNFSLDNPDLDSIVQKQSQARYQRSLHIAKQLARRLPLGYSAEVIFAAVLLQAKTTQQMASDGFHLPDEHIQTGRPHFAKWLKSEGLVKNDQEAFKKYLGNNGLGNLRAFWPSMSQGVARIRGVGGSAVLAHPGRYGMTRTKLKALISDFKLAGGHALEIVGCNVPSSQIQQLASFCQEFSLKGSQGSDFHCAERPWVELGRFAAMPKNVIPIWDGW